MPNPMNHSGILVVKPFATAWNVLEINSCLCLDSAMLMHNENVCFSPMMEGHNAPSYGGAMDTNCSIRSMINEQEIGDVLQSKHDKLTLFVLDAAYRMENRMVVGGIISEILIQKKQLVNDLMLSWGNARDAQEGECFARMILDCEARIRLLEGYDPTAPGNDRGALDAAIVSRAWMAEWAKMQNCSWASGL